MIRQLTLFLMASALPAGAFELGLPLDCKLGETCFIQNYMDRDPGPETSDFTCGPLAYDGHEGTDFALPSLAAMQAGVTVRAAAAGTVLGLRDGVPDIAINDPAAPPLDGKDCGNGVLIDNGDGWQTQYCHMKQGSITVAKGDVVKAGDPLGQVGLSGRTEFPHLHLTVRKDGTDLDPFDPDGTLTCGAPPAPALWSDPIAYVPGAIISAGFSTAVPEFSTIRAGGPPEPISANAPALVLWAYLFGSRAGDTLDFTITGPDGTFFQDTATFEKSQAQAFRASGKRLRALLPAGDYTGTTTLIRDGKPISQAETRLQITE